MREYEPIFYFILLYLLFGQAAWYVGPQVPDLGLNCIESMQS